jgi:nucleoside-diphosphate-sugar epimerase
MSKHEIHFPERVFVTGANGFIGRAIMRRCRDAGTAVSGMDIVPEPAWGIEAGDLCQPHRWKHLLNGIDLVVHTAAVVSNTAAQDLAWRINVKATADLLAACEHAGVKRFLHLSSVAAYGFDFPDDVAEDYPLRPMGNSYVDSKIASEHAVLACHAGSGLDCTIVRPADVYGPASRPWVLLPLEMIQSGKFFLPAYGKGLFSPVYIDDLVEGCLLAATCPSGVGGIFNIGGGITPICSEFFSYHARMAGRAPPRVMSASSARFIAQTVGSLTRFFGGKSELGAGTVDMLSRTAGYSIRKAEQLLGYTPAVSLQEGMRRTQEWASTAGLLQARTTK